MGRTSHRPAQAALPAAVVGEGLAAGELFQLLHQPFRACVGRHQGALYGKARPVHPAQAQQGDGKAYIRLGSRVPHQGAELPPALAVARLYRLRPQFFHRPGYQVPQAEGPGEGEGNEAALPRREHLRDTGGKKAHRVLHVLPGVEHPFSRPGGAGGGPGYHPLHLRLGCEQKPGAPAGQLLRRGKGQGLQLLQAVQAPGIALIGAAPLRRSLQGLVQSFQLQSLQALPAQFREGLGVFYPLVQLCSFHLLYRARP